MTDLAIIPKPPIVEVLASVMAEVQGIGKGDRNTQQGYSFRGVDAVVNAVGPVLRKHGVIIAPVATEPTYSFGEYGQKRTLMRECTLLVTFRAWGPAGDFIDVQVGGEANDSGDKATPKAHSVAYRTALLQLLCIPTHEPDPDSQSFERSTARVAVRRPWAAAKATVLDKLTRGGLPDAKATAQAVWAEHTPAGEDVTDDEMAVLLAAVAERIAANGEVDE